MKQPAGVPDRKGGEMSEAAAGHAAHEQAHGHGESFISKYIFSTDHKMIAKQFL